MPLLSFDLRLHRAIILDIQTCQRHVTSLASSEPPSQHHHLRGFFRFSLHLFRILVPTVSWSFRSTSNSIRYSMRMSPYDQQPVHYALPFFFAFSRVPSRPPPACHRKSPDRRTLARMVDDRRCHPFSPSSLPPEVDTTCRPVKTERPRQRQRDWATKWVGRLNR